MVGAKDNRKDFNELFNDLFGGSENRSKLKFKFESQGKGMDEFENIMKMILGILDLPGTESEKDDLVTKTINDLYEGLAGKYRPLVKGAAPLIENLVRDLAPLMASIYKTIVIVKSDPAIQETARENKKLNAKSRMESLKTYQKAGFKRNEAMMLVLQDVANVDSNIKGFGSNAPSRAK
jgi:hypothetical protein